MLPATLFQTFLNANTLFIFLLLGQKERHVSTVCVKKDQHWNRVMKEKDSVILAEDNKIKVPSFAVYSFECVIDLTLHQPSYQTLSVALKDSEDTASTLLQQKHSTTQLAEDKLNSLWVKHKDSLTNLKQHYSQLLVKKNDQIKAARSEVDGYVSLAFKMVDEVSDMNSVAASAAKKEKEYQDQATS